LQLGARKVRRWREPRARAHQLPSLGAIQRADDAVGARVLPDDRVVPGLAGLRVPDDRRLALVRDTDGGKIPGVEAGVAERASNDGVRALGNLARVVLDPSRPGHDLLVLELMSRDFGARRVEDHEPRACRALVERAYEFRHGLPCLCVRRTLVGNSYQLSALSYQPAGSWQLEAGS
jgi:hypothetical protein